MNKWIVIVADRRLLEQSQEEYEIMVIPDGEEILEDDEDDDFPDSYNEVYILFEQLKQIADYKEVWASSQQEAAKKILLKYESCVFMHVELEESFLENYKGADDWLKQTFIMFDDQHHVDLDEINHTDILIRKELFCNISNVF